MIDSQTVRAADTVPTTSSGYDSGKKIKGRKRHVAVDTGGLLLAVVVTTASLQDRDAAFRITAALREAFSTITLVWADAGYPGRFVGAARKIWDLAVAIVKRPDQAKGFVLGHRRWVVERSFAWLTKFRRLVRDYETLPATHEAMIWTAATWQLAGVIRLPPDRELGDIGHHPAASLPPSLAPATHPWLHCSSEDFGSSVERTAKLPSVMARAAVEALVWVRGGAR